MNIHLPASWQELTDAQLEYVLFLLSAGYDRQTLLAYCFVRFSGADPSELDPVQVAEHLSALDFLAAPPEYPVRPERVGKYSKARYDALCRDMTFDTYLACENFYQGYIHTQRTDLSERLTALLYTGTGTSKPARKEYADGDVRAPSAALQVAALYWWVGLKAYLARRFTHFFRRAEPHPETDTSAVIGQELQQAMDAQIRALTGGDITKNPAILQADLYTCLTELNAKAEEVEEMQKITKK